MKYDLNKERVEEMMKVEGEARGVTIKTDWSFIKDEFGDEGLEKIEKRMAELGHPLKYEGIRTMSFYPLGLDLLSILVIGESFDFEEKDFVDMGRKAFRFSIFLKLFLRYFTSLKKMSEQAPKMFKKHYSIGSLEMKEIEEKKAVVTLKDFDVHKVYCLTLKGYLTEVTSMVVNKEIRCEEVACTHEGDSHHEFVLTW